MRMSWGVDDPLNTMAALNGSASNIFSGTSGSLSDHIAGSNCSVEENISSGSGTSVIFSRQTASEEPATRRFHEAVMSSHSAC